MIVNIIIICWGGSVLYCTVQCTVPVLLSTALTVPLLGLILTGEMNQLGTGHGEESSTVQCAP